MRLKSSGPLRSLSKAILPYHSCWAPLSPLGLARSRTLPVSKAPQSPRPFRGPSARGFATTDPNPLRRGEFDFLAGNADRKKSPSTEEVTKEIERLNASGALGQPTSQTHPHLLLAGESGLQ